ncbi:MAG: hypothetical protein ACI9Y7_002773 [Dokdonia sp.]|jgi:hypothetical protein
MKNVKLLFILLAIVMTSCSTDSEDVITQADLTLDVTTRASILNELETALTEEKGVLIKYEDSRIIEVNDQIYLRAWSGDFVTTLLLGKDKDGTLQTRGVSCTTSACSGSATQCVPQNGYCTSCPDGDCTRTTTGDSLTEVGL